VKTQTEVCATARRATGERRTGIEIPVAITPNLVLK